MPWYGSLFRGQQKLNPNLDFCSVGSRFEGFVARDLENEYSESHDLSEFVCRSS